MNLIQTVLDANDTGALWPASLSDAPAPDVATAYQHALQVRQARIARGEHPKGFKIGFTNASIWARYRVDGPIWGTVYDRTLSFCDGQGSVHIDQLCQPRIEPEVVFGMRTTPPADATLHTLFEAIEWVAPGFEIVQSHKKDWLFQAADCITDGGLHGRLLVGKRVPLATIAQSADALETLLGACEVQLSKNGAFVEQGCGANVLGSPLKALHHFLLALRACPNAPDLQAGDVVTTGTWTDAWPVATGEQWHGAFGWPLSGLSIHFA